MNFEVVSDSTEKSSVMIFEVVSVDYCEETNAHTVQFNELTCEVSFSVTISDVSHSDSHSENQSGRVSINIKSADLEKLPVLNMFYFLQLVYDIALAEIFWC